MENPNYYAVIPANVRYDKDLKASEKLLYGEIAALAQKDGTCWATNKYFAELYDTTNETISRYISHLKERGYITIAFQYSKANEKLVEKRIIGIVEKINTPCENNQGGIDEKIKDNNTSNNNIPPIVPQGDDMPKEDVRPYNFDILWQEYPKKEGKASAYRSYCSWLVGKKTPLGKRKLTNEEIDTAIQNYNNKIQKEHIEYKYIKQGSTFFNLGILDYLGDGTSD